jgi:hypothetical protein
MKKAVFTLMILAAGLLMTSCGNNSKKAKTQEPVAKQAAQPAPAPQAEAQEAETVNTEDRAWYTVDIPVSWETKQYVSEMILKKGNNELNFKEQAKGNIENWIESIYTGETEKLDFFTSGDITWSVFKNAQGFRTVYVAQVNDGVVRVGSSIADPNDPEVIKILETVKGK